MVQQLTERVYVVPGGTNVGIVRTDDDGVLLIDTGLNDTTARKVLRAVRDEFNAEVRAILTTHGHADHFGANAFVVARTNARVYAPDIDETVLRHPIMQPVFLYGGADPLDTLRGRFLLAEAGPVDAVLEPGEQEIEGVEMHVVSLAGHSMNQLGFVVDGVFFCADVVFPQSALEKYRIPYLYGLTEHLDALDYAATIDCRIAVPGHGPLEESLADPVRRNHEVIDRVVTALLGLLTEPMSTDRICAELFAALDVPVLDDQGYYLLRPTVAAYLSHLQRVGEVTHEIIDRAGVWRRA
ncbi:MAG TPA: MBL fold metallo-hydrolase [Thermomicrobiales bacterium]|nr:MBL fold metallo-hydrolase [Thermomicrobiales bacterium]